MKHRIKIGGDLFGQGRSRKLACLIALIACCAALIATGTAAFFYAEETALNVITTATFDVVLHEETDGGRPWPEEGVDGVMPGMDVTKVVYAENLGTADAYVRILLDKIIIPAEGVEKELDFDNITLDINTDKWTEKDGIYYCNKALAPGEKSAPLFTNVHFGVKLGNEYMNAKLEIEVLMQAVQAKNNGDSVLNANGWPAVVEEGEE